MFNWYHIDLYAEMFTPAHLQQRVEQVRAMGCNGIVLELADRLHYRSVPDFGAADAFTAEALSDFCARIRALGMTVVPLLQHMGHLGHLLKHAAFRPLREDPTTAFSLCPLHPESRLVLEKILLETIEVMGPLEYVHLGGDEAYHLGTCPRCSAFVSTQSKSKLFMDHYVPLCRKVLDRGMRPIIWHDMVTAHPECLSELPRETILLDWKYRRDARGTERCMLWRHPHATVTAAEYEKIEPAEWRERFRPYVVLKNGLVNEYYSAEFLRAQGFDVILGSACRCSGDSCWFPENRVHLPNVAETAKFARELNLSGVCVTDWSVRQNPPGTRMHGIFTGLAALEHGLDITRAAERFATEWCRLPAGSGEKLLAASELLGHKSPLDHPDHGYRNADTDGWHGLDIPAVIAKMDLAKERARFPELREKYAAAGKLTAALRDQAGEPGRGWLEQWQLAAEALLQRLDILEAVFDRAAGKLSEPRKRAALDALARLETRTREILAPVYSPEALAQQIALRFAGERAYIR